MADLNRPSLPASEPPSEPERDRARAVRTSRLLVVAAAVLWSTSGFFAKAPLFESWPADLRGPLLAFWRAVFACVALWPFVRRPRWTWRLVPAVAIFAAMNFTYLSALVHTEAANAIWLQNTAPIWVLLIGVFVFRERAVRRDWILLGFGLAGVGLILGFELQGSQTRGVLFGLLSGLTYAGVVLSLRLLRDHESAWLVALNHLGVVVLFAPLAASHSEVWPAGWQWLYLAAFGALQMGIPYLLFARGMRTIPGHEAAGIGLLEPVLLPLWVFLAWGSAPNYLPPRWWTLAGGGLILAGLALRYGLPPAGRRSGKPAIPSAPEDNLE